LVSSRVTASMISSVRRPRSSMRACHLVLARVPARSDAEHVPVVGEVAECRDLLSQHYGMAHGQNEDTGSDLHLVGQRRREGECVEGLEPCVTVESRSGEQVIDHPHVDTVVLALLDRRADTLDVLGVAFAAAPRVGRNPGTEFQLRHREYPGSRLLKRVDAPVSVAS